VAFVVFRHDLMLNGDAFGAEADLNALEALGDGLDEGHYFQQ